MGTQGSVTLVSMGGEILRCAQDDNGGQEAEPGLGGGVTSGWERQQADLWVRGGDIVRQLGLMRIRADKSAVGAVNRPLQPLPDEFVKVLNWRNPVWGTGIGAVNWPVRVMRAFLRLRGLMDDPDWILSVY